MDRHHRERTVGHDETETIVTEIVAASKFWPMQGSPRDHHEKNPIRYERHRASRGRDK